MSPVTLEVAEPSLWTPGSMGGIGTTQEAEEWVEEAYACRSEKALRDWARIGAGHVPRGGVGSFASYDAIVAALTAGQGYQWDFHKIAAGASEAAGVWETLWTGTGSPGAGTNPAGTPGAAYDDSAPGGGMFFPDPGSSQNKFLTTFGAVSNQICVLALYDRLVGVGGIASGTTGDKTVSSAALPSGRYDTNTTALNNEAWLDVTTANTVTACVMRMNSYTTGDGTAAQDAVATLTWPAVATNVHTAMKLPLKAGKAGIQACSTINVGTAGTSSPISNFVIRRPLAYLPLAASVWNERDMVLQLTALPRIFDNAVLDLNFLGAAAITPTISGNLRLVYG